MLLPAISAIAIVVLFHLTLPSDSTGVNYGTLGDNLPPPAVVANFLKTKTTIDRIKIYDSNPDILSAFANTGIFVTLSTANGDIPALTDINFAKQWVTTHIKPFYPQTKINYICVGNEILHWGDESQIGNLVAAMTTLHQALSQMGINNIKVTTPHSLGILYPRRWPSTGRFRANFVNILKPMLQFLRETKSPFMVNPYPYFAYNPRFVNYALFKRNIGVTDGYTKIHYNNSFDALMDTVFSATKAIGYADVPMVIGETGWPSVCDGWNACSVANAQAYNWGLKKHAECGVGTPLMPNRTFETYIFALFNENQKPGPIAEKNWGLFQPDFTPVYDCGVMLNGQQPGRTTQPGGGRTAEAPRSAQPKLQSGREEPPSSSSANHELPSLIHNFLFSYIFIFALFRLSQPTPSVGKSWCVPKATASEQSLQANINYACNQGIDCTPIQPGGACFDPNTIRAHAAYVMNSYYQTKGRNDFNCDFSQSATISITDPSEGTCRYLS